MQLVIKYIIGFILCFLSQFGFSQIFIADSLAIDTIAQIAAVKPIEADFLFSYYEQDGTKSPVTGGIGDEALKDRVGQISLNIPINNKLEINFSGGVDMYSSASTDKINNEHGLFTETSASSKDTRVYGNLGVQFNNDKRRTTYGVGIGVSNEYDVASYSLNASISKLSKNRNTLFYAKSSAYYDKWKLIYPSELRWKYNRSGSIDENPEEEDGGDGGSDIRNTVNGLFSIEQDISPRMNASFTVEATYQAGLLSTPFHRVYFNDSFEHDVEKLPNHRLKIPLGARLNYYVSKFLVVRLFYRYYFDDFEIQAHTAGIELPIKPVPFFTISPFYRFHTQTASKYFNQYGLHSMSEDYYTSDYDLSNIESNRIGLELRYSLPSAKVKERKRKSLGLKKIALRGSKYFREQDGELILKSFIIALQLSLRID